MKQIESIRADNRYPMESPSPDMSDEEKEEHIGEEMVLPPPHKANIFRCIFVLIPSAIILATLLMLVIYLSFQPKRPRLELTDVVLKRITLDRSTYLFQTEMIGFLKFDNPNKRVDLRYEEINFKLYFRNDVIATQVLDSFGQRRGNTTDRFVLQMVSSKHTYLTPLSTLIMEHLLVRRSTIQYKLIGNMTVIARLGRIKHIHHRHYLDCRLLFSVPPNAVLRHQKCTNRH